MLQLLATCGRGMGTHVVREIQANIPHAQDVREVHEGKVSFAVAGMQERLFVVPRFIHIYICI